MHPEGVHARSTYHTIIHYTGIRGHHATARDNKEEWGERGLRIRIIRSSGCAGEIAKKYHDYKLNVGL